MKYERLYIWWHGEVMIPSHHTSLIIYLFPPEMFDAEIDWLKSQYPRLNIREGQTTLSKLLAQKLYRYYAFNEPTDPAFSEKFLHQLAEFGWKQHTTGTSGSSHSVQEGILLHRPIH